MNTRHIQFSVLIPVNGRLREFNFRQRNAEQYDGNTTNELGERFYFKLVRERDQWIFADTNLPDWLRGSEKLVGNAVA